MIFNSAPWDDSILKKIEGHAAQAPALRERFLPSTFNIRHSAVLRFAFNLREVSYEHRRRPRAASLIEIEILPLCYSRVGPRLRHTKRRPALSSPLFFYPARYLELVIFIRFERWVCVQRNQLSVLHLVVNDRSSGLGMYGIVLTEFDLAL